MDKNSKQFCCARCGNCCKWPGYVRLNNNEIAQIAEFLNFDELEFIEKHTELTEDRQNLTLIEKENGECIFYQEMPPSCEINPVKPLQCRNFPFIWNFQGWEDLCNGTR